MQAIGDFEEELRRRLQAELDAVNIRMPPPRLPSRRRFGGYYWVARPLAVGVVAALALGVLAISVTGSPDPGQWLQPGVWMRALGVAPPTPSPSANPSPVEEPSQSPEPAESSHPESPEPEPSEHVSGSPEPRESERPTSGEGPDG